MPSPPPGRPARARPPHHAAGEQPTLRARLRELRLAAGLSQEALGAQGFVSTPGWVKVERGQRLPSEKLLAALVGFLVAEKVVRADQCERLWAELCARKLAAAPACGAFLRRLALDHLATLPPIQVGSVVRTGRPPPFQTLTKL